MGSVADGAGRCVLGRVTPGLPPFDAEQQPDRRRVRSGSARYDSPIRRWIFGGDDFVHPWVKWLSVPLWRIGILLVALPLAITGHATWVGTLGAACLVISLLAVGYDYLERRRRGWRTRR